EVFRDVEAKVIGTEAARVRGEARARGEEARTGQLALLQPTTPQHDALYADQLQRARDGVRENLPRRLERSGPLTFGELWPRILAVYHLTLRDLRQVVLDLEKKGVIEVRNRRPRERTVKDPHVLAVAHASPA